MRMKRHLHYDSRDMCMIDHLPDLIAAGVDSVKIEGRAKSAYYAAIVTGAYRHCIDDVLAGRPLDPVWRAEVEKVSHRHYSTGFFYGQPGQFTEDSRYIRDWQITAKVVSCDQEGRALLTLNNKFSLGRPAGAGGPRRPPPASGGHGAVGRGRPAPYPGPQAPDALPHAAAPVGAPLSILRRQADLTP